MIIEWKIRGIINCADVYFRRDEEFTRKGYFVVNYYDFYEPVEDKSFIISELKNGRTLINDIQKDNATILNDFSSNVRNEVRRAKKDGATSFFVDMDDKNEVTNNIEELDRAQIRLYKSKGIHSGSIKQRLLTLWETGVLRISIGVFQEKKVVYHVYYVGNGVARLVYSISGFRESVSNTERNAIGRVNRMVHYDDMIFFEIKDILRMTGVD